MQGGGTRSCEEKQHYKQKCINSPNQNDSCSKSQLGGGLEKNKTKNHTRELFHLHKNNVEFLEEEEKREGRRGVGG